MTEGREKALNILVEDSFAKAIVTEMVRRNDSVFLQTIRVNIAGDHGSIRTTMRCLKDSGIQVAAVLDGDQSIIPKNNIFSLPGSAPPEKEVFSTVRVTKYLRATYGLDWSDYYAARDLQNVNHHEWILRLAEHLCVEKELLMGELARAYAEVQDCAMFTKLLKEAITI